MLNKVTIITLCDNGSGECYVGAIEGIPTHTDLLQIANKLDAELDSAGLEHEKDGRYVCWRTVELANSANEFKKVLSIRSDE